MPAGEPARVLVDGLDHPEGVAWDPEAGVLWAGGEAGQIYRVGLDGEDCEQVATAPGFVLGLAVDGRGRLAICASEDGSLCVLEAGGVRRVLSEVEGEPLLQPNFPAFGPDGSCYVSASGTWAAGGGRIVVLDPDGEARTLTRELADFPNGLCLSADRDSLWAVESYEPRLSLVDLGDGTVETITRIDGTVPDGLAPTAGGGLLVGCYRPDRVYHLDRDGGLEIVAEDPRGTLLSAPTNVCFAGADLDRAISANLGRWHLTSLDLGLRGAPLHRPPSWAADL